jgi:hypothetical protein
MLESVSEPVLAEQYASLMKRKLGSVLPRRNPPGQR